MLTYSQKIINAIIFFSAFTVASILPWPAFSESFSQSEKTAPKNNILLILIDALRSEHLGCYGYPRNTSPFIDEVARGGIIFKNFYSVSSWTNPVIMTLFTGQFPQAVFSPSESKLWHTVPIPRQFPLLAEIFKARGFKTAALVDQPFITRRLGYNRGFDQFFQFSNIKQRYGLMGADSQKITRALKNFIKEKPEKKFFIYLHLLYLHQPYNPPAPYQNMFGPGYNFHQTLQQLKKTDREGMINNYDGEIRMTDDLIKNIFELLKKYQLLENTYVIITADHGEGFFDHGQVDHGNSLHGELLKIPLIIHLPKNSKLKPKIVAESASNIALFPTLIELAQITKIPECSGQSLFKLFARKPPAISNPKIFSESPYKNSPFQLSFQNRDFKIIYEQPGNFFSIWEELAALGTAKCQLYAIKADTEEKNNLASRRPLTKILLAYQVIKHKKDNFKKRNALKDIDTSFLPDKETLENLRSLGYLQ